MPWLYMCLGARAIFYSMHTAEWCGVVKAGIVKCNGTRARTIEHLSSHDQVIKTLRAEPVDPIMLIFVLLIIP